jgi:hypothetical protein
MPYEPRNVHHERYPQNPGEIAEHYPAADTIHLVVDNLSTHTRKALVDRFGEAAGGWLWERFTVHYTPKHGSWLNHAEIEISLVSRQSLGTRPIGNIATPPPDKSMEPPRQSRQNQNPMEVYPKTSSSHAPLLFHAVTVLAALNIPQCNAGLRRP